MNYGDQHSSHQIQLPVNLALLFLAYTKANNYNTIRRKVSMSPDGMNWLTFGRYFSVYE